MARGRIFIDKLSKYIFLTAAAFMSLIIFSIILFVGKQGLMSFLDISPLEFFFSARWDPFEDKFGALSFIVGSLLTTLLAVIISGPLGIMGALFLARIAPGWMRNIMEPAVNLYAAIPSVIYGYLGLVLLVPWLGELAAVPAAFGVLAASIVLAIMILPTIIAISTDALNAVEPQLEEASIAIGATFWQTCIYVLLPAAKSGIITAIILAMARAAGETMAVQMLIGNTPQLATGLFIPTATLTSNIVVEMGNTPFGSPWGNALFLMAFILLLLSLLMILIIRRSTVKNL